MAPALAALFFVMFLITLCLTAWFGRKALVVERESHRVRNELEPLRKYARIRDVELAVKALNDEATEQRKAVLEDAREIRGKALKLKDISSALRNTIDGYGLRYLEPNHTVLDELAEEYSATTAGDMLKEARRETRKIAKEGRACTQAERNTFVSDPISRLAVVAFNERVEDVLSRKKIEDFGTLAEKISDAAALTNKDSDEVCGLGISDEYLDARLTELKWTVALHEFRKEEREEQRQIKEQIREEQRLERELREKLKQEEKEERLVHAAMAKLAKKMEDAKEAEVGAMQAEMDAMRSKVEAIEAEKKRALSQAQITRKGHVYVVSNIGSFGEGVYKIGLTRRLEPLERVKELSDASVPFDFDVHAILCADDSPSLEKAIHHSLDEHRVNKVDRRKEFFRVDIDRIRAVIEGHCQDAQWTLLGEKSQGVHFKPDARATEYHQTLVMEARDRGEEISDDMLVAAEMDDVGGLDRGA